MTWYILLSAVVLLLAVSVVIVYVKLKRQTITQQQTIEALHASQVSMQENITLLRKQLQEYQSANEQKNRLLSPLQVQLEKQQSELEALQSNVQLLQSESTENKFYSRAKKMIEMGADLEEVILECEMPRAEAELLFSLYRT